MGIGKMRKINVYDLPFLQLKSLSNWSFVLLNAAVSSHEFTPICHSQNLTIWIHKYTFATWNTLLASLHQCFSLATDKTLKEILISVCRVWKINLLPKDTWWRIVLSKMQKPIWEQDIISNTANAMALVTAIFYKYLPKSELLISLPFKKGHTPRKSSEGIK